MFEYSYNISKDQKDNYMYLINPINNKWFFTILPFPWAFVPAVPINA
jgi:hypothetical protein